MFDFLKKGDDVPPDVGKEVSEEVSDEDEDVSDDEEDEEEKPISKKLKKLKKKIEDEENSDSYPVSEMQKLEIDKLNARVESLNAMIAGYGERISMLNQQIGEVRAMNLANEKAISRAVVESSKAVDIVKEVKPDKLRIEYQKADVKVQELQEKILSYKEFMETIIKEIKEVRKKMSGFVGTENLLNLNDDVKKDLIETQQIAGKTKMYADKVEQLFAEMRRGIAENQKVGQKIANLDSGYSEVHKILEKLKIDFSKIVSQTDFDDFKKTMENKIDNIGKVYDYVNSMKEENERLIRIVEKTLAIAQKNKRDIGDIAMVVGDDHIQRVSDYDNKLSSVLEILDTLAGQISAVKKKTGILRKEDEKISVEGGRKIIEEGKLKMKHMKVAPDISEKLSKKIPSSAENLRNIGKVEEVDERNDDHKLKAQIEKPNNKIANSKLRKNKVRKLQKDKEFGRIERGIVSKKFQETGMPGRNPGRISEIDELEDVKKNIEKIDSELRKEVRKNKKNVAEEKREIGREMNKLRKKKKSDKTFDRKVSEDKYVKRDFMNKGKLMGKRTSARRKFRRSN